MLTGAGITKKLDLPHEPGEWVEIRPLSWRQVNAIRDIDDENEITCYVLSQAIVGWSYGEPVTPETLDRLDAETAVFVIDKLRPGRQKKEEAEEDRKNVSDSSTPPSVAKGRPRKNGS